MDTTEQLWTSLVAQTVKCLFIMQEAWFDPWVGKIPWRGKWQPAPVLLPGKCYGQRILVGYIQPMGLQRFHVHEQIT